MPKNRCQFGYGPVMPGLYDAFMTPLPLVAGLLFAPALTAATVRLRLKAPGPIADHRSDLLPIADERARTAINNAIVGLMPAFFERIPTRVQAPIAVADRQR
jgi:hypothetical protein